METIGKLQKLFSKNPVHWTLRVILLMDKILHCFKYPKLWELWYIPYNGSCRILSINRTEVVAEVPIVSIVVPFFG